MKYIFLTVTSINYISEYGIEGALNQFTIYARESEDGIYIEYLD